MLSLEETKKATRAWPVIVSYSKAVAKYPWIFGLIVLGNLLIQFAGVAAPLYLSKFINIVSENTPSSTILTALFGVIGTFALVNAIGWVGHRIQMLSIMRLEGRVMSDLSNTAFSYLLGHSHDFFISNFAGTLTRRVNRYARAFEQVFDTIIFNFFSTAVYAIGIIVVLFTRNAILGTALFVWTIIFVCMQILMARWRHPLRVARAEEDSKVTGILSDAVSNETTISLFSSSGYERSLFAKAIERWRKATLRSWLADAWMLAIQGVLAIGIEIGLLVGAVMLWERGLLSVGDFVLIQVYIIALIERVWNMGGSMRKLYDGFADAYEMVVILKTPPGIVDVPNATTLAVPEASITMKDVSFRFNEARPILEQFSLHIAPREKIALVGPSGAGKSTITKLLLRLYDVTSGAIEIDGQNIAEVTQDSLRNNIAFVPQEPVLFHRSLMDNIRYGRQEATDEEVMDAARKAHCHDFISTLPFGYETYVGERGVKLSGGERQRVAIARAILKDAPILILDEATSSLDSESEALIQDALKVLMEGKTVVVIAHRLSTIMTMDRIVVIEGGRLVSEGTHNELLDKKTGLYHKLWSIQAGGFLEDEV
ncbi:MAG: ABC transporter ATP-binding protein [Minisyncoccia bacterium]